MVIKNLLAHKYLLTLALAYTSVICWLSLGKIIMFVDVSIKGSDKVGHLLAYFVFAIVWFLFFFYSEKQNKEFSKSLLWASVLGFLVGVLMEILQGVLTNYRNPDWYDILANTSGIIIAMLFLMMLKNKIVKVKMKLF